jgi:tetratricopeptide (TPR) repeat protein
VTRRKRGRHARDAERRLSESRLWELQRAYFEREGLTAWSDGVVPHYVTSNAFIGRAYAQAALAFFDDCGTAGGTVVELGAGSGRFTHHFLKAFLARSEPDPGLTYVVTDFTEATLAGLREHPDLAPFAGAGLLRFARFDAAVPSALPLPPGPVALIANYVFDSIPQDCFAVRGETLYEELVTLVSDDGSDDLDAIELRFRRHRSTAPPYEDDARNRVLEAYREALEESTFLFPTAALDCIDWFLQASGGRLLVLSADKGHLRLEDLEQLGDPWIAHHGSVSLMVNFHAIGEWVRERGGLVLHPDGSPPHIAAVAYAFSDVPLPATRRAYVDALDEGGPDDFFSLKKALEEHYGALPVEAMLALLRFSGYDASVFQNCADTLLLRVSPESEQREDLRAAAWGVWDRYFPIGEHYDLAFAVGRLLYRLAYYDEAAGFFQRSTELVGPDPATAYNEALCEQQLGNLARARELIEASLELDPDFAEALGLQEELVETANP